VFSLAFKNAVHDAFNLGHYWHRLRFLVGSTGSAFAFGPRNLKDLLWLLLPVLLPVASLRVLRWHILN
jgi:hypothetical protein